MVILVTQATYLNYYSSDEIRVYFSSDTNVTKHGIAPHVHNVFEMIYLLEGDITYVMGEKVYNVTDNHLILTRPNLRHFIKFNNKTVYDRYMVTFQKSIIHSDIYGMLPNDLDVITFQNPKHIISLFEKYSFYCNHLKGDALKKIFTHITEEIFLNIIIARNISPENISKTPYVVNPIIKKATDYITENLMDNFSLESLCKELYISKSSLQKLFVKHLEITPKRYIISKRLAHAQKLLRAHYKPTEIYSKCGFSDYSSFYRDFKNYFGYPPSEEVNKRPDKQIII